MIKRLKFLNSSKIFIMLISFVFLFHSCLTLNGIKNKSYTIAVCTFGNSNSSKNSFDFYFRGKRYGYWTDGGQLGLIEGYDKFLIVFDSINPDNSLVLYHQPVLDSLSKYYKATALITNVIKKHHIPIYNTDFTVLKFGYNLIDQNGISKDIIREQYFLVSDSISLIQNIKSGDEVKILVYEENPKIAFIDLDNYYYKN